MGPQSARSPLAAQWLDRTKVSYRAGDFEDARDAAAHALAAAPNDVETREIAARIALVRLDYAQVIKLTEGLDSSSARGLRGRAYWFSGDIEHAADELEAQLSDPTVKDSWAQAVAGLARRGVGRHPFEMDGGLIGAVEMPQAIDRVPLGAANVVPCELDGERILALVATGSSELLLDSNSRREPAWVSLRFDRVEVKDVPALVEDLSPIARQIGVPIKALIGAQLLRHTHATIDRRGDQFVVRRQDAAPPPDANRVPLYYVRGGGMLLRATVSAHDEGALPLLRRQLAALPAPPARRGLEEGRHRRGDPHVDPRRAEHQARYGAGVPRGRVRLGEDARDRRRRPGPAHERASTSISPGWSAPTSSRSSGSPSGTRGASCGSSRTPRSSAASSRPRRPRLPPPAAAPAPPVSTR